MKRRDILKSVATLAAAPPLLAACGGGESVAGDLAIDTFTADRAQFLVGDVPVVVARFRGGRGEIVPGGIPVTSGVAVALPPLARTTTYRLVVRADDGRQVMRDLVLQVGYRGRWTTIEMGFARAGHAGAELADGRLAVFGGETGTGVADAIDVYAFDLRAPGFARIGALQTARTGLTATTLGDGRVLVVGSPSLATAPAGELFDPGSGTTRAWALRTYRAYHTATLLTDGRVLLVGGSTTPSGTSAELVDPRSGTSELLPNALHVPRGQHRATRLANGRVLICGGVSLTGGSTPPELFDPATGTFELLQFPADEPYANRALHALATAGDGRIHVVGGEDAFEQVPGRSTLVVSADGRVVGTGPLLQRARAGHTVTPLADGRLLAAGGFQTPSGGSAQASCELLAADGSAWSAGPELATGRVLHTAHLLSSGKVLVVGGNDAARGVLRTAELFD